MRELAEYLTYVVNSGDAQDMVEQTLAERNLRFKAFVLRCMYVLLWRHCVVLMFL